MKQFKKEDYAKQVKRFKKVTPDEADHLLKEKSGRVIYIGFESCPYCRKFVHTLSPLAGEEEFNVYYVDAKDSDSAKEVKDFRDKYAIPTVPGFLYSSETAGLIVKTDSSLTASEILELIEFSK